MKKVISLVLILMCVSLAGCVSSDSQLKNNLGNSFFKNDTGEYGLSMLRYGMTAEEALTALREDINEKSDFDINDTVEDKSGKEHSFTSYQRGTVQYYEKTGTMTIQCVDDALFGISIDFSSKDNDLSGYYEKIRGIIKERYDTPQTTAPKEEVEFDGAASGYSSEYSEWESGTTRMKVLVSYQGDTVNSVSLSFCDTNRAVDKSIE